VSGFFSGTETFEVLERLLLPRLLSNRSREAPIRVWVAGCSTGEEVYSLAMSLLDLLEQAQAPEVPLRLFGTDTRAADIARARAAVYPASVVRAVSSERLARHFCKVQGSYVVQRHVRDLCVFAAHDPARDPSLPRMDLVSVRDLAPTLATSSLDQILAAAHDALKGSGFLLLGSAKARSRRPASCWSTPRAAPTPGWRLMPGPGAGLGPGARGGRICEAGTRTCWRRRRSSAPSTRSSGP